VFSNKILLVKVQIQVFWS